MRWLRLRRQRHLYLHTGNTATFLSQSQNTEHVLPAASLLHDPQLVSLVVQVLGQMSVARDAPDLRVVLELLLQLLAVVEGLPLPRSQLGDTREEELLRIQLNGER